MLRTNYRVRLWKRKGTYVNSHPPPPTIDPREVTHLWVRLPTANHRRLMGLLSQLVERQLINSAAQGEDGHEGTSHPCRLER